ncbi:uncharacterized protein LOC130368797 [Hyla sarda]|uniref:uncharacterized protein LOC130309262 n=1 Tax=Hyla sarda TaxID=327740 RepID=UPI0024C21CB3|nr:uncharacterized protein LOC130309262 [Hyla sarda]XP_056409165.1 uncharacterized protein LOC130323829 [Hyla sarda]XP_056410120.1 uncharacterized protein LOC130340257 [Hyla sarda]XP_056410172.1 uncharacterized protein LOC130340499 [Hyla sarda]XP_056410771.1 uncharacterized protein LOC130348983 [Hyla sarda]XP_056427078.1 uncharacterized protein LOC130367981 [Hyla sarda]XP_056427148.1 uncharacterized protein LOC130368011 [Hyla sarda]XP_056429006.1 uncharacterized protein LOC130368797 [Hyla sa
MSKVRAGPIARQSGWTISDSGSGSHTSESESLHSVGVPLAKKQRGPKFTEAENVALVAAVSTEKFVLFNTTVGTQEKMAAWSRVREKVSQVGSGTADRTVLSIRHRYYDCRASVVKKIKKQQQRRNINFKNWELELKKHLLPEAQTSEAERSDQQGQASLRSHHDSSPPSPVLSQLESRRAVEADDNVPVPEEDMGQPLSSAACSPAIPSPLSPTPAPASVPMDTYLRVLQERDRLSRETRHLAREMQRLNRAMHRLHRRQADDFQVMLARVSQQHLQATAQLRVDLLMAISGISQSPPLADTSSSNNRAPSQT